MNSNIEPRPKGYTIEEVREKKRLMQMEEEQSSYLSDNEVKSVIDFLMINIDFFVAPFVDSGNFQKWAKDNEQELTPLSEAILKTRETNEGILQIKSDCLVGMMNNFLGALLGNSEKEGLIHGNVDPMKEALKRPSEILRGEAPRNYHKVIDLFLKHVDSPIIEKWYVEEASDEQRQKHEEIKEQNQVLDEIKSEKIKFIDNYLNEQRAKGKKHQFKVEELESLKNKVFWAKNESELNQALKGSIGILERNATENHLLKKGGFFNHVARGFHLSFFDNKISKTGRECLKALCEAFSEETREKKSMPNVLNP